MLSVKEMKKGKFVSKVKSVTYFPMLWKLLTRVLTQEIYKHQVQPRIFQGRGHFLDQEHFININFKHKHYDKHFIYNTWKKGYQGKKFRVLLDAPKITF